MATATLENLNNVGSSFNKLPIRRQLMILLMVSASIAIGIIVAMWTRSPDIVPLYAQLDPTETQTIMDSLDSMGVSYKYDRTNGIMVNIDKVDNVRMKLAAQGLPKTSAVGYELLDQSSNFGTSQFMENVRYRRSLEGELAKTIMGLDAIRSARVHLGLPRQTSFIKRKNISSASVMVDLYGGRILTPEQVMGIVYLVSSSVAGLTTEHVSVIDQTGKLLTSTADLAYMSSTIEASNYSSKKEQAYARKIQELLEPMLGPNSVRAEVSAFFDFTQSEETHEEFKNEKPTAVRSEALTEEARSDNPPVGIPGALSNQPPSIATAPESLTGPTDNNNNNNNATGTANAQNTTNKTEELKNYRNTATRNYELDKKISHTKYTPGTLVRLSVAVVLNDKLTGYDPKGLPIRQPLTAAELTKVEDLVKQAIGYNAGRGDSVSIVNTPFAVEPPIAEPVSIFKDPSQILQKPWFAALMKNLSGGAFLLFLIFGIMRPIVKMLAEFKQDIPQTEEEIEAQKLSLPPTDEVTQQRVDHVKQLAHEDTKKAAQVVMNWVGDGDD
jgi:flagellar M-ring protein FliF